MGAPIKGEEVQNEFTVDGVYGIYFNVEWKWWFDGGV